MLLIHRESTSRNAIASMVNLCFSLRCGCGDDSRCVPRTLYCSNNGEVVDRSTDRGKRGTAVQCPHPHETELDYF